MARVVSTTYVVEGVEESKRKVGELDAAINKSVQVTQASGAALGSLSSQVGSFFSKIGAVGKEFTTVLGGVGQAAQMAGAQLASRFLSADTIAGFTKLADVAGVSATALVGLAGAVVAVATAVSVGVKQVIEYGSAVHDLALRVGLSTDEVQFFGFAAKQSGSSVEAVTRAISLMSRALVEGDKGAAKTLKAINLELTDLRTMEPGAAFETIAEAIRGIPDPMRQTQVALEVFGRSGTELLPLIKEGVSDLREEFNRLHLGMSGDVINSADDAGDALSQLWDITKSLLNGAVAPLVPILGALATALTYVLAPINYLVQAIGQGLVGAFVYVKEKAVAFYDYLAGNTERATGSAARSAADLARVTLMQSQAFDMSTRGARVNLDALGGLDNIYKSLDQGLKSNNESVAKATKAASDHRVMIESLGVSYKLGWDGAIASTTEATELIEHEFYDLAAEAQKALKLIPEKSKAVLATVSDEAEFQGATAGNRWGSQFGTTIAQSLLRAFQGGGDVGRSLGGAVGNQFGQMAGDALSKAIGGSLGGVLGSILPGIGTALGGLAGGALGGLMGKLFKSEGKQVNNMRDEFIAAAGGLDALNKKAAEAGLTLDALLKADKVKEFNEAVDQLNLGFGEQAQQLSELQGLLEKYGLTWEDVGQKAKQAHLEELAMGLESDMRKLERAGVDNSKILQAMARHFSELAQVAQATGTQIPASLAKTFEQLADMGLLIDANGNALEAWRDLFGSLPGAARSAADGIEDALSRIDVPDIRIPVSYDDPGAVSFASLGGLVGRDGVQYLARGGRVLPFAARGTDTVPAMLTPGEFVVDAASVARAGGPRGVRAKLAGSGSGATYHVTVNANDAAGGRSAAAAFDREMRRRGIRVAG